MQPIGHCPRWTHAVVGLALVTCGACGDDQPGRELADAGATVREVEGPHGTVTPRYFLSRILYTASGSKFEGCVDVGQIEYRARSSLGTLLTAEASFKDGYQTQTRAAIDVDRVPDTYSCSLEGNGLDIAKPKNVKTTIHGSCDVDGVDQGLDVMEVWVRPRVDLTVGEDAIRWTLDLSAAVGVLRLTLNMFAHPETLTDAGRRQVDALGLTADDLKNIADLHPFAHETPQALTAPRFVSLGTLPFEPSFPNARGLIMELSVDVAPETHPFERATTSYSVPLAIDGDEEFTARVKEVLKDPEQWTWTSASHHETRTSDELVAFIHIGSPGPDYSGPISLGIYYDTIYRTFALLPREL